MAPLWVQAVAADGSRSLRKLFLPEKTSISVAALQHAFPQGRKKPEFSFKKAEKVLGAALGASVKRDFARGMMKHAFPASTSSSETPLARRKRLSKAALKAAFPEGVRWGPLESWVVDAAMKCLSEVLDAPVTREYTKRTLNKTFSRARSSRSHVPRDDRIKMNGFQISKKPNTNL